MIQCQNCGQGNASESQFCRFCGTKFLTRQSMQQSDYALHAPRPYSWKTDEFQTQAEARKVHADTQFANNQLSMHDPGFIAGN
jgi:hypothetical protein